jgi:hypothetical protein
VTHPARTPNYNTSPPFSKSMITLTRPSPEHLGSLRNTRVTSMEVDKKYHKDYISVIFIFRITTNNIARSLKKEGIHTIHKPLNKNNEPSQVDQGQAILTYAKSREPVAE